MNKKSTIWFVPLLLMILAFADIETTDQHLEHFLGTRTIAHVAIIVNDIEATTKRYAELFGLEPPRARLGVSPQYLGKPTGGKAKMAFIKLDNITLEFFEPVGGPSAWQEFLEKNGEGVHHFGFVIKDLEDHVDYFESRNMQVIQSGGGDWGRYRYVDASPELATMIELLEMNNPEQ